MVSLEENVYVLHELIVAGNVNKLKEFLKASSGPKRLLDTVSEAGYTALFRAAVEKCEPAVMEALLKFGPTIDGIGEDGETPLYIACHNRLLPHVKMLIEGGAQVNSRNGTRGDSPLHCAAQFGFVNIADTLLKHGADINSANKLGETPLFCAARAGKYDMVFFLLVNDANKIMADRDGKNPLYIASEKGHKHCVALLKAEKGQLRVVKSNEDVEMKHEATRMLTPEEIAEKLKSKGHQSDDNTSMSAEQKKDAERKQIAAAAAAAKQAEIALREAETRPKEIRTHDPFTGKPLGPCRTLEEVGYTPPPQIPPGMHLEPAVYPSGGGTSMVVGTGTGEEFVQPPQLSRGEIEEDGPGVLNHGPIRLPKD